MSPNDTTRTYPRSLSEAFGRPNDNVVEHYRRPALQRPEVVGALVLAAVVLAVIFAVVAYWIIN